MGSFTTHLGTFTVSKNGITGGYLIHYPNRFWVQVPTWKSVQDYIKVLRTKI